MCFQVAIGSRHRAWVRAALVLGCGIAIFTQLSGIEMIIYYSPTILTDNGFSESAALEASVAAGHSGRESVPFDFDQRDRRRVPRRGSTACSRVPSRRLRALSDANVAATVPALGS